MVLYKLYFKTTISLKEILNQNNQAELLVAIDKLKMNLNKFKILQINFKYKLYKNLIFKGKKNKICKRFILHQIIKLNNFLYLKKNKGN